MLPAQGAIAAPKAARQPAVLTLTGTIPKSNREPFDPVMDRMIGQHGLSFTTAYEFDTAALQKLASVTIKPTVEYDAKRHTLEGPLLTSVLEAAGVTGNPKTQLVLRAVDGYNVALSVADARAYRMVVALRMDGRPLGLGGLGPQWALYDADQLTEFRDKPLKERFGLCPWGLYHIEVKAG